MDQFKNKIIIGLGVVVVILAYFLFQKEPPKIIKTKVPIKMDVVIPGEKIVFEPSLLPKPKRERERPIPEFEEASVEERDSLYRDAVKIREYTEVYEDSLATATVNSTVEGKLKKQSVSLEIKEKTTTIDTNVTVEVEVPKKIKFYGGLGAGVPLDMTSAKPVFNGTVGLQDKKDRIFTLGINTEGMIQGGVMFKF
jgi:hypothetical protein